jgi:hypothetical protein
MRVLPMIAPQRAWPPQTDRREDGSSHKKAQNGEESTVYEFPSQSLAKLGTTIPAPIGNRVNSSKTSQSKR